MLARFNDGVFGSAHPIHMHGHRFSVVKVGYPNYDENSKFISPNDNIECTVHQHAQKSTLL